MPVRLPVGRTLFLLAFFAFALGALLPMRLAISWLGFAERGLTARAATGSVWSGALQEARIGPVALGDVGARLNFLPLFLGRARLAIAGADPAAPVEGAVTVSRHGIGFDDVTGRFRLAGLLAPLPVASLALNDVSAGFASGRCVRAEGRVQAAAAGELAGAGLAGNARCDDGALLLPLASQTGMERLDLRLYADGRWRADLRIRPGDPATGARLLAAGFAITPAGYVRRIEGTF